VETGPEKNLTPPHCAPLPHTRSTRFPRKSLAHRPCWLLQCRRHGANLAQSGAMGAERTITEPLRNPSRCRPNPAGASLINVWMGPSRTRDIGRTTALGCPYAAGVILQSPGSPALRRTLGTCDLSILPIRTPTGFYNSRSVRRHNVEPALGFGISRTSPNHPGCAAKPATLGFGMERLRRSEIPTIRPGLLPAKKQPTFLPEFPIKPLDKCEPLSILMYMNPAVPPSASWWNVLVLKRTVCNV
jgi:hypothetical protein